MEHQLNSCLTRATRIGLGAAVLGAVVSAGCRGDGPTTASGDLQSPDDGTDCVDHHGFQHCPLGAARLFPSDDRTVLEVERLAAAGKDGVAILLSDVTEFSANGTLEGRANGSTLVARSINEGVSTSVLNVRVTDRGYLVSATFTGSEGSSRYNVKLYSDGVLVGSIRGVDIGDIGVDIINCAIPSPTGCLSYAFPHPPPSSTFRVIQRDPNAGACVWALPFGKDDAVQAVLDDGSVVVADLVELEEVVPGRGSYPYLTFNRIDYTWDGGSLRLEDEHAR